jgi:hypothetical protein
MSFLRLVNDLSSQRFVFGYNAPEDFTLPKLKQEDILYIAYQAVTPTSDLLAPHRLLNLSGYSLTISIGTAGDPLAQQATFTPSADNFTLTGSLSLNTSGIALLDDGASTILEAQLSLGSTAIHRTQQGVKIAKAINVAGALVAPAGDTALGRIEADRLFVRQRGDVGQGFILRSEDGTKEMICYLHNDGSFRTELIT